MRVSGETPQTREGPAGAVTPNGAEHHGGVTPMAVQSIAVPADPKRDARARALATQVAVWPLFTLNQPHGSFPIGSQFRQATGSHGEKYLVNAVVCECVDYTSGHICKHIRAFVL